VDGVASVDRARLFWKCKAESESCGDPTAEGENAVWPDLRRNPQGRASFPHFCVAPRFSNQLQRTRRFLN